MKSTVDWYRLASLVIPGTKCNPLVSIVIQKRQEVDNTLCKDQGFSLPGVNFFTTVDKDSPMIILWFDTYGNLIAYVAEEKA